MVVIVQHYIKCFIFQKLKFQFHPSKNSALYKQTHTNEKKNKNKKKLTMSRHRKEGIYKFLFWQHKHHHHHITCNDIAQYEQDFCFV